MADTFTSALDAALRYAVRGWPVFPCRADKTPHTPRGFFDATTDEIQIIAWWRNLPDAQIGVACGAAGICVIDLDIGQDKGGGVKDGIAAFSGLCDDYGPHGCGLIASTPRGGRHYVYMATDPPAQCGTDIVRRGIDVRSDGGYIVVPSPNSPGRDWVIGDPFDVGEDGTTDLAPMPAWVRHLVLEERQRGTRAKGSSQRGADSLRVMPLDMRQVAAIQRALSFLDSDPRDTWIRVGMALKSTGAKEQAFDLWAEWSQTSPKYREKDQLYQWNSIREFRMDGSEITLGTLFHYASEAGYTPSAEEETAVESVAVPAELAEPAPAPKSGRPFPAELLNCPGLVGSIASWMLDASTRQQPAMCLASALATMGAVCGRRVSTPTDLRTNLYMLGIGKTACGKDPSIKLPNLLLSRARLERFVGPGEWKSDSGLRAALMEQPSHACYIDEFTKVLDVMSGKQVPPHIKGLKRYLLQLFTVANAVWLPPGYADRKLHVPTPIEQPNLCIYGTGVPEELFSALDRGAVSDGFLNRFLVFFADADQPPRRKVGRAEPPQEIVDRMQEVSAMLSPENALPAISSVGQPMMTLGIDDAADELMDSILEENDRRIARLRGDGDPLSDLWVRMGEHVAKVACVRTASEDPTRPIGEQDIRWANDLVVWCLERMAAEADSRVSDSQQESLVKRVRRLVVDAGSAGISTHVLTRGTQWLRRSDRKDILQTLVESGEVVVEQVSSREGLPGGRPKTVYVGAHFRSAEDASESHSVITSPLRQDADLT